MNIPKAFLIVILLSSAGYSQEKFWDKQNKLNFALDGAAKAYDGYMTHSNVYGAHFVEQNGCIPRHDVLNNCPYLYGFSDGNPIARPFVKTTAGQIGYFSASLIADTGIAYLFHKTGHHKLERWAFRIGAAQSTVLASTWWRR